jgi:aerobic carbon-monoxide dehydrogenase medium subunit
VTLSKYYRGGRRSAEGDSDTIVHPFEYHAPGTLEDALALAERYGEGAKFLAGGQSLLPMMKLGLLAPSHIIDLGRVAGLDYVREAEGVLAIGGLTRMADIEASELLRRHCPVLTDCASHIADPLIRNMGTIGGNVCHADPANDIPAVAVATSAEMVLAGPRGERKVPASQFFLDTFTTAIGKGEVLKELRLPAERCRGSAYAKLERQAGDFAVVGVAARLWPSGSGTVKECGLALTAVGPTVIRAKRAEEAIEGHMPDSKLFSRASGLAAAESRPVGDLRGSEEYKREMVAAITKRALAGALKRARGAAR